MNKRWIVVIVLIIVLAGLLMVAARLDGNDSISANDMPTSEATSADTTPAAPDESEKSTVPAVEDSVFDDAEDAAKETLAQEQEAADSEDPKQDADPKEPTAGTTKPDKKPESTEPTQKPTEPATKPTEPTTKPTEPAAPPSGGNADSDKMTYDEYHSKSPAEQKEYMDSFEDIDGFFDWYNSAKEEYDAQNPDIEVGDGSIDLGEIIGGNGG